MDFRLSSDPLFWTYVAAFGVTGLTCLGSLLRARRIGPRDVRDGLVALLVASGTWALADVASLLLPARDLKAAVHVVGLAGGFATVWAWLYFCSAYTGRALHRNPWVRYLAVLVYGTVVVVKVLNPMHEAYFTIVPMTTPFAHLGIQPGPLYWITNALAYGLSLGGYLMLAPLLWRAGSARAPLVALVGVTALPLVLNAAGALTPLLLGVNHDALGVACFAVGVLFAYTGYFQDVQLFSGQDGPALTVDRHGRIRTYNTAAQNLFSALREGEATGKPLRAVLPEVAAASEGEGEARVFRHPADAAGPTDAAYYQVTASRFGAGLDQPGRLLVISDVTPLQAAKEKAEAAQRAAEAANRLKSQFLAGVAHDLCSPLTSIVGFADVLKEELAIPHQARQAAMIEQAGRRIEKMADQILDLARMEAGSLRLDLAPCDVCRVAEDVVHTAQDDARHAGIDLVLDVPLAPAMALADEEALRRVIDNLIRNAIKYGSAGDGVRVWVRQARPGVATLGDVYEAMGRPWTRRAAEVATGAAFSLDADEAVVLAVEDTGPGIDPAFLERLFEPFARNAPGTEGTGLGLAVTKELVARMGGCIHVCSKEGTGTCFRVRLPAAT